MLQNFDTRSAIALSLVAAMIGMSFVLVFRPTVPDSDVFKMLIGGLMTVGFATIISFYFGSSAGSKSKDDTLNQIAVASATPVAPPVKPWWLRLTDEEKSAITATAQGLGGAAPDARVAAFVTASQVGAANADDLTHLVSLGLLTQARADAVRAG